MNVTFPEEYQAAELAGKAAVFKIKLHEVKYKELPALDDELAKDCSEYDTLEEFKESIRKNNQEQLDKQDDLAVENALVDQVIESMEAEIPRLCTIPVWTRWSMTSPSVWSSRVCAWKTT